jgi:glycerol-3-phosphate dehydrogenase
VKVRDLKISCDVVVVGGGAVGAFATLDLTLRGVKTVLLERRYVCSGTSGRSHGMLHSGARYVASDERAARECISENTILSRIAPHCVRDVGGDIRLGQRVRRGLPLNTPQRLPQGRNTS